MTSNELDLLMIIREAENIEQTTTIIIDIICAFLTQHESSQSPSVVALPEPR